MSKLSQLLICFTFLILPAGGAFSQDNPGLLNLVEILGSAQISVQGNAGTTTIYQDEILSWIEEAAINQDFGKAHWGTTVPSDSIAFLDVNLTVAPQSESLMLASLVFKVRRPGFVLYVPADDALFDVAVLETSFTFAGNENMIRERSKAFIRQCVTWAAGRIQQNN